MDLPRPTLSATKAEASVNHSWHFRRESSQPRSRNSPAKGSHLESGDEPEVSHDGLCDGLIQGTSSLAARRNVAVLLPKERKGKAPLKTPGARASSSEAPHLQSLGFLYVAAGSHGAMNIAWQRGFSGLLWAHGAGASRELRGLVAAGAT